MGEILEINWQICVPVAAFVVSEILGVLPVSSNGIIQAFVIGVQAALKKVSNRNSSGNLSSVTIS